MKSYIRADSQEFGLDLLRNRLIAFFRRKGYDSTECEDLAQDVFLRLSKSANTGTAQLDGYIFTIARNLHRDNARRSQVRKHYGRSADWEIQPILLNGSDAIDPERVLVGKDETKRLMDGLAELPKRTREILLLYRLEGYSQRAIAERMDLSVSAVEKNVARAMLHLLGKMDRTR